MIMNDEKLRFQSFFFYCHLVKLINNKIKKKNKLIKCLLTNCYQDDLK